MLGRHHRRGPRGLASAVGEDEVRWGVQVIRADGWRMSSTYGLLVTTTQRWIGDRPRSLNLCGGGLVLWRRPLWRWDRAMDIGDRGCRCLDWDGRPCVSPDARWKQPSPAQRRVYGLGGPQEVHNRRTARYLHQTCMSHSGSSCSPRSILIFL